MWRYQGSRGCWHQIAMQCYLAIYPMLRSLYAAWIVDQASRDRTWFLIPGDNAPLARLGGLAASYFVIYVRRGVRRNASGSCHRRDTRRRRRGGRQGRGRGRLDARETGAPRLRPPRAGGAGEAAGRRGLPGTGPGGGEEARRLTTIHEIRDDDSHVNVLVRREPRSSRRPPWRPRSSCRRRPPCGPAT
jgi:hypothetical protein